MTDLCPSALETEALNFDVREFRNALGMFATGVTIVTTVGPQGERIGLTVNSFNSLSLDPPLVLWSLARRALSAPVFAQATQFAVHVLTAAQMPLAQQFATPGIDRWEGVQTSQGIGGLPLIEAATAIFECAVEQRHEAGDHTIYIGRVQRCRHEPAHAPLLYHGGRFYRELPID